MIVAGRDRSRGRWPLVLAAVLAGAFGLYLVAGNLFLNAPIARQLANREPEKFVASWRSAWTLYPGHVGVADLRIAGHVRHTVWSVQADSARGRVALRPLLTRELRVPRVIAAGVTGGASLIDVERTPAAPGPGGWTLRFDRIVAREARHAYLDDLVIDGLGNGESGFVKVLRGGTLEVLPSRVAFGSARVVLDGTALAREARIETTFAIASHRREQAPGIRKLGMTDFTLRMQAVTAGVLLQSRTGQKPSLRASDGPGALEVQLEGRRGTLAPGGRLRLSLPVADDLEGQIESTRAELEFGVKPDQMELRARLAPTRGASSVHADADLRISGRTITIDDPAALSRRTSGHIVSQWHFESLAWLSRLLPESRVVSFDGAGRVLADLRLDKGHLAPGSQLDVPHVAATAEALGNRFVGDAHARITFEAADGEALAPRLDAVMEEFEIAPADAPGEPYVRGQGLTIEAHAQGPAGALRERISARLRFSDARVPDLRVYNRYLPPTAIQFARGAGTLSGDLHFFAGGAVASGELAVNGKGVQLTLADLSLEGDVDIETRLGRANLQQREFNADGSRVSLRRVRVIGDKQPLPPDWWADIVLDEARLEWQKPTNLEGRLRARMKDVSVLLALYSKRKDLPAWIRNLLDEGEATAEGRVEWQPEFLLLEPIAASNERFDVLARMRLQDQRLTGDLFARWGALSVGVELADGRKQVHLVGARKWFDGRPSLGVPEA